MNGCLIPHTPIAVDFWKIRECPQARIFFLTHLHGDHITGLTSSWSYPIYCSEITGKLLVQRHGVKEELIHALQTECAEIIYLDNEHQEQMTVTAIDANHCPGAVMFLMQGYFGTILHTGDFRYQSEMITQSVLSQFSGKVDILYLDNTYCSPGCVFPNRDEATLQIINIIEQHPSQDVLIGMRNLGKEYLLCKIAMHFHDWISVPDNFYRTLEVIGAPDVFDNTSTDHRIRVVPFHKISNKFVHQVNQERETIVILPTALYRGIEATPYENNDKVFVVPYSDHSSYNELRNFVSFVKPKKIIPVVKGNARGPFGLSVADRADMTCFAKFTSDGWNSKMEIPISVQAFMHCKNSKMLISEKKGKKRKAKLKQTYAKKVKRGIDYDSPKSGFKENCKKTDAKSPGVKDVHNSENDKENSKAGEKDIRDVKRILFENKTAKPDTVPKTLHNEEKVRMQCENVTVLNCETLVSEEETDSDCKKLNNTLRRCVEQEGFNMNMKKKCKNGKQKQEFINGQLDRQDELKSRQPRENRNKLKVQNSLKRSSRNLTKRYKDSTETDDSSTRSSPSLNREYQGQNVQRKASLKRPLKFVSSKQDYAFDNMIGIKTYSKSNGKMKSGNKMSSCEKETAGNEEASKFNETAKWILRNSEWNGKPTVKGRKDESDTKYAQNISKLKAVGQSDEKDRDSTGIKYQRKPNTPASLKQSTLSQYLTKQTKKITINSALSTENQEIYTATKLGQEPINGDQFCRGINSMANLQYQDNLMNNDEFDDDDDDDDDDDAFVHCEFYGNNEKGSEQKEEALVMVTDSEEESSESNMERKDTRKEHYLEEEGLVCEHDLTNDSVIAQAGTQAGNLRVSMDNCLIGTNKVNVKAKEINLPNDKDKSSLEIEYLGDSLDNSLSIFDKSKEIKTTSKSYDTESCEKMDEARQILKTDTFESGIELQKENVSVDVQENSEILSAELNNEAINCIVEDDVSLLVNPGTQGSVTIVERAEDNDKIKKVTNLETDDLQDMSTLANVGTQKEVNTVEKAEGTVKFGSTITAGQGRQTPTKSSTTSKYNMHKTYKGECRKCELDAFRQALEMLENCELKERDEESQSNQKCINQASYRYKGVQEGQSIKCSFKVKPVRQ